MPSISIGISSPVCTSNLPSHGDNIPGVNVPGGVVIRSFLQKHAVMFSKNLTAIAVYHPHISGENYKQFLLTPTAYPFFWVKDGPEDLIEEMMHACYVWLKAQPPHKKRVVIMNQTAPERVKTVHGGLRSQPWEHYHCVEFDSVNFCGSTEVDLGIHYKMSGMNSSIAVMNAVKNVGHDNYSVALTMSHGASLCANIVEGKQDPWTLLGISPKRIFSEDLLEPCRAYIQRSLDAALELKKSV